MSNILKFLKDNGLKAADVIALVEKQMSEPDLLTGEEKAEIEAARLKAEAEAKALEDAETEEEPEEEPEPEDIDGKMNKLITEKFKNMEINLTNHINDALKIKRKKNPGASEPTEDEKQKLGEQKTIESNHFEVLC